MITIRRYQPAIKYRWYHISHWYGSDAAWPTLNAFNLHRSSFAPPGKKFLEKEKKSCWPYHFWLINWKAAKDQHHDAPYYAIMCHDAPPRLNIRWFNLVPDSARCCSGFFRIPLTNCSIPFVYFAEESFILDFGGTGRQQKVRVTLCWWWQVNFPYILDNAEVRIRWFWGLTRNLGAIDHYRRLGLNFVPCPGLRKWFHSFLPISFQPQTFIEKLYIILSE